jgi:hypothetical protein
MYKITSEVFGVIKVAGKDLGYKCSTIVPKLDQTITELQQNKLIRVTVIEDKKDGSIAVSPTIITTKKKKNK